VHSEAPQHLVTRPVGLLQDLARQVKVLLQRQLTGGSSSASRLSGVSASQSAPLAGSDHPLPAPDPSGDELLVLRLSSSGSSVSGSGGTTPSGGAAADSVEEHLLTFGDVPELQARNQQLVRVVRALVRQLQKAGGALGLPEDAATGPQGTDTRRRGRRAASHAGAASEIVVPTPPHTPCPPLPLPQAELEELRVARERQESIVGTLVQQRDMYRVLLQQQQAQLPAAAARPRRAAAVRPSSRRRRLRRRRGPRGRRLQARPPRDRGLPRWRRRCTPLAEPAVARWGEPAAAPVLAVLAAAAAAGAGARVDAGGGARRAGAHARGGQRAHRRARRLPHG